MSAPNLGADAGAAPPPPKPRLKINVSRSSSFVGESASATSATKKTTPLTTPGDGAPRKVKLKISSSQPPTPAVEKPPVITKAGRQPKPTQKLVESKKRPRSDEEDEAPLNGTTKAKIKGPFSKGMGQPPATKIKIKPIPRGRPPVHPPGDGYDSEASDNEVDPAIEEQFVLRMLPGEHCDYVRWCMENGKIGVPKAMGGADLYMRFFEEDSRRGVVTVKGQPFAAVMVDLPTITESMKTWDRKSLMKSADICQMLFVFQQVKSEEEARHIPLPSILDSSFKWPHGLTPPMHDCVHRRFAKTISRKEIEDKEAEVERLLGEDAKCASTKWEWVDERKGDPDDDDGADEDAEGEMDETMGYFGTQDGEEMGEDNDLEADLEAAFADEFMADTPATGMDSATPMTTQVETPAPNALQQSIEADESEEDEEEEEDDDDDDDDDEDLDEDQRAARDEEQGVKDIINDLKKQLALRIADFERTQNKILRTRLDNQIKQLKSEIALKLSSIGLEADD
ncbi:Transcription initiation factor TFIID subunit 7 [Cladobotryum mycophilum]|uniref:Transcription initiation factor TFIID subunit 7 n=1 Tax=Cladobotryum mycophilum TaxID=491253 RepID=A0ABR0SFC4_9HYPO